ncbi:DNA methyltransferase [Halobacterium jilantaiense]|uniref:DNA methylase N-4/N-6 domain-containing protein n=1 Tax=Halobacterium jilantaiense TaxID=355548 RepID=A0A1I0Q6K9_9EURY|nr:DNA methyltransferase [Halobacterium jilantaiense]SEW22570.1 hypothetical protein SAMN04487945_2326 [Halobacterium jilantaiense]
MFLVDLTSIVSAASSLDGVLDETSGLWASLYDRMDATETLWVVAPNDYRDGQMWPVSMAAADAAREESNLVLKNTITLHTWDDRGADMESAYDEILFLVKDKREYQFHKDRIRTAHVYQGHEWGGERETGNSAYHDSAVSRYNEDGKDPGNVWLEEDRTQTDTQEVNETNQLPLEEAVRRCVLAGSSEGETVQLVNGDHTLAATIAGEDREVDGLDITTLRGEVVD